MLVIKLSRRNLQTLLSKLDRKKTGEDTYCAILKSDGILVIAEENPEHYGNRVPGAILPQDEPQEN